MPGYILNVANPQSPRLAKGDTFCAFGRVIDFLERAACVGEKQFSRIRDSYPTGKTLEQLEANFFFQILDLTRKGGLSHAQVLRSSSVVLLFSNSHEIPQLPHFHTNSVLLSV